MSGCGARADWLRTRLWLFDFDNTIAALEPKVDWAASRIKLEAFLRREGIGDRIFADFPKGNLLLYDTLRGRLMGPAGIRETSGRGLARLDPRALLYKASRIIETYELIGVERAEPLPGASELLRKLAERGFQVLIVTSNSSRAVGRWLGRFGLRDTIEAIVGRDSMLPLKPAPDMILFALDKAYQAASAGCFIGDSDADAIAADRAGLRFYGVASDAPRRDRLRAQGAVEVFSHPAEIAARLEIIAQPPFTD
jgi:phosphoglycolate phosphatase-like HAD superfamily hydrolase